MMKSSDRAYLRSLAHDLDPILHIGRDGITGNVLAQADEALTARELIKCTVQQTSDLTAREACDALCDELDCEGIAVIGRRFVLYRRNKKEPKITIPK